MPHNRPTLGVEEERAVVATLRSGWVGAGPEVRSLEDDFCRFLGLPAGHAVAVSSGTAALCVAVSVLVPEGSTVAFPAYVCGSLRRAVRFARCRVRILDSTAETPNLDLTDLGDADAVIVPHIYGLPVSLTGVQVPVIEDCSHALGARVDGGPVGTLGHCGVASLQATKLITSGGSGGVFFSRDRGLVDRARELRDGEAWADDGPGSNFQMSDVQAAIGRAQLRKLPQFLQRRAEIFDHYVAAGLDMLDTTAVDAEPVRYRAVVLTDDPAGWIKRLAKDGITVINPHEERELLAPPTSVPRARRWTQRTVSLPCYPSLGEAELMRVIEAASR